jgi:hypothetical protein
MSNIDLTNVNVDLTNLTADELASLAAQVHAAQAAPVVTVPPTSIAGGTAIVDVLTTPVVPIVPVAPVDVAPVPVVPTLSPVEELLSRLRIQATPDALSNVQQWLTEFNLDPQVPVVTTPVDVAPVVPT